MAVVSRAIPTLLRGISQAADSTKQADHADIQDNANSNPVLGLTKRSGTQYITTLSSSTVGNVHIQTINRDTTERYVAIFSNGNVKVYELDGTEKTVTKPDGTARKFIDSKLLNSLGFKARVGLKDGLVKTYNDFTNKV